MEVVLTNLTAAKYRRNNYRQCSQYKPNRSNQSWRHRTNNSGWSNNSPYRSPNKQNFIWEVTVQMQHYRIRSRWFNGNITGIGWWQFNKFDCCKYRRNNLPAMQANVTGTVAIANGGTGKSTQATANNSTYRSPNKQILSEKWRNQVATLWALEAPDLTGTLRHWMV